MESLTVDGSQQPSKNNDVGRFWQKDWFGKTDLGKIGFGKTDLGKNRFWKNRFGKKEVLGKTILEKSGLGKTDFGKNRFWENRFGKKSIWEKPILEQIGFGKIFFLVRIPDDAFLLTVFVQKVTFLVNGSLMMHFFNNFFNKK